MSRLSPEQVARWKHDGFLSPFPLLDARELEACRQGVARYEAWLGAPINADANHKWRSMPYLLLPWAANLARKAEVTGSVVKGLIEAGALVRVDMLEDPPFPEPSLQLDAGLAHLSDVQQGAAREMIAAVNANEFRVALLDGVKKTARQPRHRGNPPVARKPVVNRIVLDFNWHERSSRPPRMAQCEAAHVVGGLIDQNESAILAIELQPMT